MEHLNQLVKTALKGLGANKTEKAISTAGEVLGVVGPILAIFDAEHKVRSDSGSHQMACIKKDMAILLKELKTVFSEIPGREHNVLQKTQRPTSS